MTFKTAITREINDALRNTFDNAYPIEGLRDIFVGPDFQQERERYPMIYFVPTITETKNVGLGHFIKEESEEETGDNQDFLQWMFTGQLTLNCLALTSQGRDELADNVLNVLAFGKKNSYTKRFHDDIYDSDWILMYLMTERITPGPNNEIPVPWGSENELLYHCNFTVDMTGEFFSDPYTAAVIRISTIIPMPYRPDQPVPKGSQLPADINEPWVG